MFFDCKQLSSFNFPSTVTEIGMAAFRNCESLKTITIPKKITTVGSGAFAQSGLVSGSFEYGTVNIPDHVFQGCNSMATITMPDTVKTIGEEAFNACNGMEKIEFSSSLETIGVKAFYYCKGLKTVTFPESLVKTDQSAFEGCSALEEVNLNENIQYVKGFNNCTSLKSVVVPKNADISGSKFGFAGREAIKDFILYGYSGSKAEKYASANGVKFVAIDKMLLGDVNGDGFVNITDATLIQKYCAKLVGESDINLDVVDVNNDGEINISDATAIQKILVS